MNRLAFWKHRKQAARLDAIAMEATELHHKNITRIQQTRHKADTLNEVLRQNSITLQLAKAIGHR